MAFSGKRVLNCAQLLKRRAPLKTFFEASEAPPLGGFCSVIKKKAEQLAQEQSERDITPPPPPRPSIRCWENTEKIIYVTKLKLLKVLLKLPEIALTSMRHSSTYTPMRQHCLLRRSFLGWLRRLRIVLEIQASKMYTRNGFCSGIKKKKAEQLGQEQSERDITRPPPPLLRPLIRCWW
ncbi:hypothetical protein CEXT_504471 [Caerostris extrusa]|uniref:Uncharacterized protein n=1 Tax=Caerostris extrusa TaxID=172846 RepID=A0AAV4XN42_CAEEX|nr:hypothetical protein CEXT_504471 [Caerostris extrusa]